MADDLRPNDIVASIEDGQRFRITMFADGGELIVCALTERRPASLAS